MRRVGFNEEPQRLKPVFHQPVSARVELVPFPVIGTAEAVPPMRT